MPNSFKTDLKNNNIKLTTKLILSHIFSGDSLEKDNVKNLRYLFYLTVRYKNFLNDLRVIILVILINKSLKFQFLP